MTQTMLGVFGLSGGELLIILLALFGSGIVLVAGIVFVMVFLMKKKPAAPSAPSPAPHAGTRSEQEHLS